MKASPFRKSQSPQFRGLRQPPDILRRRDLIGTPQDDGASALVHRGSPFRSECPALGMAVNVWVSELLDLLQIQGNSYSIHQHDALIDQILVGDGVIRELSEGG